MVLLGLDPRRDAFRLAVAVGGHDDATITISRAPWWRC